MSTLREVTRGLRWPLFAADLPLSELRARYELPSSRYVEVDGVRVHVAEQGQGPTLVLVHGLMASLHTWDGWVERLADRFRIVRLDLPGFGLTGPDPQGRHHGDGLVKFFENFRQALGLEHMHVAGSSLGGYVGWRYAVEHPERVGKLILVDPLGYPMEPMPFIRVLGGSAAGRWLGQRVNPRGSVELGVYDVFGDRQKVSAQTLQRYQDLALRPGNRRALVDFCAEFMRMHRQPDAAAQIRALRTPTLLQWGTLDRWIPPSQVQAWQQDVPGLKVALYEGAGHIPMEEIPEQTASDAREFLLA